MAGQFSPLERKSIDPIALAVKGGYGRAMQRFVSDASSMHQAKKQNEYNS